MDEAIWIVDHEPIGVQRQVTITTPRIATVLGVRVGDRLGALLDRRRVTCTPQSQTMLDCTVTGTRFSLRTEGTTISVEDMLSDRPDLRHYRGHTIRYIQWLGPVRTRAQRAESLERGTVTRGGIGPVTRMRVEKLREHLPPDATTREQRTADGVELVVARAGRPFLRFLVSDGWLTDVVVETPDIPTANGIRVGDTFARELAITTRLTCEVEHVSAAGAATWRARCSDGDVELVLAPHATPPAPPPPPTVAPAHVAADRIVEIRSRLH
ncbi:MAG: hypothetical protein KF773_21280 [Deltaproteobacteria bacterium]|nr:hypothetical protein [Deltaproteobacteria bacterium]